MNELAFLWPPPPNCSEITVVSSSPIERRLHLSLEGSPMAACMRRRPAAGMLGSVRGGQHAALMGRHTEHGQAAQSPGKPCAPLPHPSHPRTSV